MKGCLPRGVSLLGFRGSAMVLMTARGMAAKPNLSMSGLF
jgi:hypothetical protein